MEKKITKKEMFGMLLEVEGVKGNADFVAFIEHEIELIEKKAHSKGKSKISDDFKKAILKSLDKEVFKACGMIATTVGCSTQKASPTLKKLREEGLVTISSDKKTVGYRLTEEGAEVVATFDEEGAEE